MSWRDLPQKSILFLKPRVIIPDRLKSRLWFPRGQIRELIKELEEWPGILNYAIPNSERIIEDGLVSIAVMGTALQDFVSPIKTYLNLWSELFILEDEDRKVREEWREGR